MLVKPAVSPESFLGPIVFLFISNKFLKYKGSTKEWMSCVMYATEFLRTLKIFLLVETKARLGRKTSRTIADLILYDCMKY